MVGVRGFEPPTPSSRTRCATSLRYTPTNWCWRAYTVMTDFSQVFFKKTRSTIIHFVSVSPSSLARNRLFPICFLPFQLLPPRATAFYYLVLEIFSPKHKIFADGATNLAALKSCLPPRETSVASLADFFFLDVFSFPRFGRNSDALPIHPIRQRSRRRAPPKAGLKNISRFLQPSPYRLEKRSTIIGLHSIGFIIFYATGGIHLT